MKPEFVSMEDAVATIVAAVRTVGPRPVGSSVVVGVTGPVAAGKSTLARALVGQMGGVVVSTDH